MGVTADQWSNPAINPPGLFDGNIEQPFFVYRPAAGAGSLAHRQPKTCGAMKSPGSLPAVE